MKRLLLLLAICGLLLCALSAQAAEYVFRPADADLEDLPHAYFYTWGVQWTLPALEEIVSARLTYRGIYDWTRYEVDHLYTHLLDSVVDPNGLSSPNYTSATTGGTATPYKRITIRGTDNEGGGDKFAGQGLILGDWNDPDGPYTVTDLAYDIPTANFSWLSDGNFGFGIDPDCHYYNCGVDLKITTRVRPPNPPIPEPSSIILGFLGFGALAGYRRMLK